MKGWVLFIFFATSVSHAQKFTRGIGVYPGDPKESMGPSLVKNARTNRNLTLHRPAYQSSAYDNNLTAQLVTDGLVDTEFNLTNTKRP